ncbi:nucleotidyltransferase domain-containing protein [Mucilaginibacter sp. AW1-3]
MSDIKKNILATLAYFDVFNYPLTQSEIFLFLGTRYDHAIFSNAILSLVAERAIYKFDNFYTLKNDLGIAKRRSAGNKKAAELIKVAERVGNLLIKFPYVRGIGISGSLSKNFADEQSDIDLFIITAGNRLWVARTLLHFFKKMTFLVNKQHLFCMNYFIDEQGLEIVEKNIYTAIEVATLIPLEGDTAFEKFYSANPWTRIYLPNNCMRVASAKPVKSTILKRLVEALLNNQVGTFLDKQLMHVTANRWLKKSQQKRLNTHGIVMGMDASEHCAKPDPTNFQNKLIDRYQNKVGQLLQQYETNFAHS